MKLVVKKNKKTVVGVVNMRQRLDRHLRQLETLKQQITFYEIRKNEIYRLIKKMEKLHLSPPLR